MSRDLPARKNIRIPDYNYAAAGAYFITFCTKERISIQTVINQTKRRASMKSGYSMWQKGYYEHIVRNPEDYRRICEYIENNPAKLDEMAF